MQRGSNAPEERAVVIERYVAASPDTLFSLFASTEAWLRWQGTEGEVDPRPGGVFRVNVTGDGFVSGRFTEVVPARRLVFTWGWEGDPAPYPIPPGASTVEIDIEPEGAGTRLRLTHRIALVEGLAMDELVRRGWEHYVERLAAVAEERPFEGSN